MARLPGDLGNLEKSENLKTTKIKNLTLKTPKSCRFQGSDPKLDLSLSCQLDLIINHRIIPCLMQV